MDALFTFLASYWWILLIFAGMGYGAFEEWLDFKREQRKLGASAEEMSEDLTDLKQEWKEERVRLTRRIEHLEAIVTSQTWDALHEQDATLPPLQAPEHALETEPSLDDEERARRLAKRIR